MKDHYEVLEVAKDASAEEIHKAYINLSRKNHPDKNIGIPEAEVKYKEVQNAYEVLKDPQKRQNYDQYGFNEPSQQGFDFFESFFNFKRQPDTGGRHIETELVVSFMEAACGCKKQLDFDRRESCRACKGTGAKDGVEMKDCVVCDGKGRIFQRFGGNSFIKMESTCSSCRGTGKVISAFCPECHSKGFITKSASVEINIPAGIESGMKVHLREQGDRGVNGRCGDLYCTVQIMPHALFQRQGKDILLTVPISYTQAVLGAKLEIPYLHGKCDLIVPSGTKSGAILRLHALGLPDIRHGGTGNLLVKVEIDTPKVLGLEYVELLNKLRIMEETNISINIAVFNEKVRLNEN